MSPRTLLGPGGVHLADLVLAVLLVEAVLLVTRCRMAPRACVGLLGAGLFLTLAMRCALAGAWPGWIAACLLLALLAHLDDLRSRLGGQRKGKAEALPRPHAVFPK